METKAAELEPNLSLDGLSKQWMKQIIKEAIEQHEQRTKPPISHQGYQSSHP